MSKVLVDDKDLEKIKSKTLIGVGNEGICYLNNGIVTKIFHNSIGDNEIAFCDMKSSNISFPEDILVNDNNRIMGYTMNYLSGNSLIDGFNQNTNLTKLKEACTKLKKIILHYEDIYMEDICVPNVLFDQDRNEFNLIDTSRWYKKMNSDLLNYYKINRILIYVLLRKLTWIYEFKDNSTKFYKLYRQYLSQNPVEFCEIIESLEQVLKNNYGVDATDIEDLTPKMYKKSFNTIDFFD